eukprot:gene8090-10959_t
MGRRKKAVKKVFKKKAYTVGKVFKCLFCNHDKSVTCALDTRTMTGQLECKVCDATFETKIHTLTDPIDVFTEWLDRTTEAQLKSTTAGVDPTLNEENNSYSPLENNNELFDEED